MRTIKFPKNFEYDFKLADCYFEKGNYSKACEKYIHGLSDCKIISKRKKALYKLAYCLGREGNLEFKEEALMKILTTGDVDLKPALLLFINSYSAVDFDKTEHYFRLMRVTIFESMLINQKIEQINISDKDIDPTIFKNLQFDEDNACPIGYVVGDNFLQRTGVFPLNSILTTANDRARNALANGLQEFNYGNLNKAIEIIDEGLNIKKADDEIRSELFNAKAYIQYQLNMIEASFASLQEASFYNKNNIKTLSLYLAFAEYSNNIALKEETIEAILKAPTTSITDVKIKISTLSRLNMLDKALDFINSKLKEKPYSYEFNKLKGIILLNMNDKDGAVEIFKALNKKYSPATDMKFYLYYVRAHEKEKIYIDCMNDFKLDGMRNEMLEIIQNVTQIDEKDEDSIGAAKFAFDYMLRQPYDYTMVTKNLVYFLDHLDKGGGFLFYLISNGQVYNSKYLVPLTYKFCLRHMGNMYFSTANGMFTRNPIIDVRHSEMGNVPYSSAVVNGFHLAFSVVVNDRKKDSIIAANVLLRCLHVLDYVNREYLISGVKDEQAFAEVLYKLCYNTHITEDYNEITLDSKVVNTYNEKFDIINYTENFNKVEEKLYGNFRGREKE